LLSALLPAGRVTNRRRHWRRAALPPGGCGLRGRGHLLRM